MYECMTQLQTTIFLIGSINLFDLMPHSFVQLMINIFEMLLVADNDIML